MTRLFLSMYLIVSVEFISRAHVFWSDPTSSLSAWSTQQYVGTTSDNPCTATCFFFTGGAALYRTAATSTIGYHNIALELRLRNAAINYMEGSDACVVQYNTGSQISNWNQLSNYTAQQLPTGLISLAIPSDADNNIGIRIRFTLIGSAGADYCMIQTITLTGVVMTTAIPTSPTKYPTKFPTKYPSKSPSQYPTKYPTKFPTQYPTKYPSKSPTEFPTKSPSKLPSKSPSKLPSKFPTKSPSKLPSKFPTKSPSQYPINPTFDPTNDPTMQPTMVPTEQPTTAPTKSPVPETSDVTMNMTEATVDNLDAAPNAENKGNKFSGLTPTHLILIIMILIMTCCLIILFFVTYKLKKARKTMDNNIKTIEMAAPKTSTNISTEVNSQMITPFGDMGDLLDDNNEIYHAKDGLQRLITTSGNYVTQIGDINTCNAEEDNEAIYDKGQNDNGALETQDSGDERGFDDSDDRNEDLYVSHIEITAGATRPTKL